MAFPQTQDTHDLPLCQNYQQTQFLGWRFPGFLTPSKEGYFSEEEWFLTVPEGSTDLRRPDSRAPSPQPAHGPRFMPRSPASLKETPVLTGLGGAGFLPQSWVR